MPSVSDHCSGHFTRNRGKRQRVEAAEVAASDSGSEEPCSSSDGAASDSEAETSNQQSGEKSEDFLNHRSNDNDSGGIVGGVLEDELNLDCLSDGVLGDDLFDLDPLDFF